MLSETSSINIKIFSAGKVCKNKINKWINPRTLRRKKLPLTVKKTILYEKMTCSDAISPDCWKFIDSMFSFVITYKEQFFQAHHSTPAFAAGYNFIIYCYNIRQRHFKNYSFKAFKHCVLEGRGGELAYCIGRFR